MLPTETGRPLRILIAFRAPVGGLFRNVYDLTKGLVERGHKIGLICDTLTGGARGNMLLAELEPKLELGLHRVPMHRNPHLNDLRALRLIVRLIREKKPDVLHGQGAKGGLYARLQGVLTPNSGPIRCYTPHGGSLNYYPGSWVHRGFMKVERLLEYGTDLFLFESQFVLDRFNAYVTVSSRPTRVALNGLYPHEFEPVIPQPDARDFLYVGEFREAKGIDTFVEAMLLLAKRGVRPSVMMVGSGPSEERIRALISERGLADLFTWRGVTPARDAFQLGRVMVVPSRFESLPYIVLEAVAGGLPLISTNVGGIPEILDKDYHYLIPPNDPERLAQAMSDMLSRPHEELRSDAVRLSSSVNERFRVDLMVDGIIAAYRQTLAQRRNG
ncbi:RfaG Glycosyltransferase [Rhabdaerophilaceae bacterium]